MNARIERIRARLRQFMREGVNDSVGHRIQNAPDVVDPATRRVDAVEIEFDVLSQRFVVVETWRRHNCIESLVAGLWSRHRWIVSQELDNHVRDVAIGIVIGRIRGVVNELPQHRPRTHSPVLPKSRHVGTRDHSRIGVIVGIS